MKILVTGSTGFIGRHVTKLLVKTGNELTIVDRNEKDRFGGFINASISAWKENILNLDKMDFIFKCQRPEAVIHLAAQPSLQESWKRADYDAKVNIIGTINLLGLCQKYKVKRFVFASTSAVYAPSVSGVYNEASPTGPLTPYGVSKLAAENYIRISRVPYTILRLGNVYGPGQKPLGENQLIPRALAHIYQGKPFVINGDGEQKRDFVYVKDVADAFLKAVKFNLSQTFNIGSGVSLPINHVLKLIDIGHDWKHGPDKAGELWKVKLESISAEHYLKWKAKTGLVDGLWYTEQAWNK